MGGHSPAALRRAVRFGDAWHPLNLTMGWIRRHGLPALRRTAEAAGRPVPAFAPRVLLRITEARLDGDDRLPGQGTLDQVRRDVDELAELGASAVLFDTYPGSPDRMRPLAEDLAMLDPVLDALLPRHTRT